MARVPMDRAAAILGSARWAAWADAIGFVTEMAHDQDEVRRRAGVAVVETPVGWRRQIGGRFGPSVELPAGTYSDDTQLRLAVSRCLRSSGRFDVETFSKIELPIFLSYGLGVGRGTRTAAQSLSKRGVRWLTNFFDDSGTRYVNAGGNGAAMRIQPHVWASDVSRPSTFLLDVVSNAICTHGHPRGIVGAAFHALVLSHALRYGELPEPRKWAGVALYLQRLPALMQQDEALRERWIPLWEQRAGAQWSNAVEATVSELEGQLRAAAAASGESQALDERYIQLCRDLGGLVPETRGAGTTTVVLALWVAWHAIKKPASTLAMAANVLGSDTDTVATVAGGLVGAIHRGTPPGELLDDEYIAEEARRCAELVRGETVEDFAHPDLINWVAPRTLADALGTSADGLVVAGLGPASALDEPVANRKGSDGTAWQWVRLDVGQTLLIKRRTTLAQVAKRSLPRSRPLRLEPSQQTLIDQGAPHHPQAVVGDSPDSSSPIGTHVSIPSGPVDIDAAVSFIKERDFDPVAVGSILLSLCERDDGLVHASLFLGAVAEAYRSRRSHSTG